MPRPKGVKDGKPRKKRWDTGLSKKEIEAVKAGIKPMTEAAPTEIASTIPDESFGSTGFTPPPVVTPTPAPPPVPSVDIKEIPISEFDSMLNDYQSASSGPDTQPIDLPPQSGAPKPEERTKYHISGAIALAAFNQMMPRAIVLIAGFFDAKYKQLKYEDVAMSAADRKELEPLADYLAQIYLAGLSPLLLFFIMTSGIYAANFTEAVKKLDKNVRKG